MASQLIEGIAEESVEIVAARAHPAGLAPVCFVTDQKQPMIPQPFHRAWLDAALENSEILLLAARNHAKSEYYSAVLPAWLIGHNSRLRVVHITSTDGLAEGYSRRLQRVVDMPAYRQIFPYLPPHGRKWATNEWTLDIPDQRDPTWRCAGRCGAITGGRADIIIVDDVVTEENARTAGERLHTLDWFQMTLMPMLIPGGKLLVIGSRYHEDDLYGQLMRGGMKTLHYPAEDESGNILWPERFTREHLDAQATAPLGSLASYTMQYLCRAISTHGEVFKREWFDIVPAAPVLRQVFWSWETAVTASKTADYTAGILGGIGEDGDVYILRAVRGQWNPTRAKTEIAAAWEQARAVHGSTCQAVLCEETKEGSVLQSWLRESNASIPLIMMPTEGKDKFTRASPVLPYCEGHRVKLVAGGWNDDLLTELVGFTQAMRHAHDDQVDALVYLLRRLYLGQRAAPIVFL